jgi:hypothetical protein
MAVNMNRCERFNNFCSSYFSFTSDAKSIGKLALKSTIGIPFSVLLFIGYGLNNVVVRPANYLSNKIKASSSLPAAVKVNELQNEITKNMKVKVNLPKPEEIEAYFKKENEQARKEAAKSAAPAAQPTGQAGQPQAPAASQATQTSALDKAANKIGDNAKYVAEHGRDVLYEEEDLPEY